MAAIDRIPAALKGKTPDRLYKFQFTSLNRNSNKWYTYEVFNVPGGIHIIGKYGRVLEDPDAYQVKDWGVHPDDSFLNRMRDEREHTKGYQPIELHAVPVVAAGNQGRALVLPQGPAGALATLILAEAGHGIAQYLSTTVDQLSHAQIALGQQYLDGLEDALKLYGQYPSDLIERYYNTIPTILPRKIDIDQVVDDFDVSEQETRLQQLDAAITSHQATQAGGASTSVQSSLGADLVPVDDTTQEYASLWAKIRTTWGSPMKIEGIWAVTIPPERAAYIADSRGKQNRVLLFHGTRNEYIMHILRSGLKVPRSGGDRHVNGRSFGDAIYLADKAGKSQNYCMVAGKAQNPPKMMLLVQASLGSVYHVQGGKQFSQPPAGYDSVQGDAYGSYGFNEIMIYRDSQCTIRYLVTYR